MDSSESSHGKGSWMARSGSKVRKLLGFTKPYNLICWVIFSGAMIGFVCARLPYLSLYGVFCSSGGGSSQLHAAPGECFYYLGNTREMVGIALHLIGVLPASFLACLQFVPIIRHRAILFHRMNGYFILLLSLLGVIGAFLVMRHAFGGGIDTQAGAGLVGICFLTSLLLAYINIKRLQIEQHRAWMLRAWFYAGSVITTRIILVIASIIISNIGGYYQVRPCAQINSLFDGNQNRTLAFFPDCAPFFSGANPDQQVLVTANLLGNSAAAAAAALGVSFGPALWMAFAVNAVGIEIYLRLTPAEAERLRNVSYQRQIAAGMKNPGSAGLTVDRFGDAEKWVPASQREHGCELGSALPCAHSSGSE